MRILTLTPDVEAELLDRRLTVDPQAERVAARIVADVRRRGDRALLAWTQRLDRIRAESVAELRVRPKEFLAARRQVDRGLLRAVRAAARNIRRVAERQLPRPWSLRVVPGVRVGQQVRPLESIGCYIPGGRAALLSTLLMTVVPAQVAGVRRIVVACPQPSPALLAAADLLGVRELFRIGGAQAVAALAYGTESLERVEKIFGPGNRYVTAAKQLVSHDCATDLPAGPTELVVLARRGRPSWIAADMIAQAEHDPDALVFLVTPSRQLARAVRAAVAQQLWSLPETNPAWRSLEERGAILVARTLQSAVEFASRFAPEHLSLPVAERGLLRAVRAAGSVFLGPWSAQPLGDYATGSNHVLPTGGWARVRGGLSAGDFVKTIAVQHVSREGLRRLAPVALELARAENLPAHARAVRIRQESRAGAARRRQP
ncbi:MAG: histidinol dehydrogenase [Acidobacteriia bacterium]|jgi:histidinol dehydrogenase|nr:histidinol dehydrogenase [Terriglobia bacterium]